MRVWVSSTVFSCLLCALGQAQTIPGRLEQHAFTIEKLLPYGAYVHSDDPPCRGDQFSPARVDGLVRSAVQTAKDRGVPISTSYGALNDYVPEADYIGAAGDSMAGGLFGGFGQDNSACLIIMGLVPADSSAEVRFFYRDNQGDHECQEGADCAWAKFETFTRVVEPGLFKAFGIVFKNWSGDRNRSARAEVVMYTRPGEPLSHMSVGPM